MLYSNLIQRIKLRQSCWIAKCGLKYGQPSSIALSYFGDSTRNLHSYTFSRNLKLFSNSKIIKENKFKITLTDNLQRPMVLLYTWLMAKESHAMKYVNFYADRDIDVLKIRISPFDVLHPTRGSQVVADQVLQFLHSNNSCNPLVVHGFSVGAYVFSESMVQVNETKSKHAQILKRFVGQIWDSGVDVEGIPIGVPKALTDNAVIQSSLEKYLRWYLKANYKMATQHYNKASLAMHSNVVGVPALVMFSRTDPISTPAMNARVYRTWEADGSPVFTKCFERSPHVSHYHYYRKDYSEEVDAFLEGVGLLEPSKGRAVVA